ncbi:hypothetical protein [Bradyrhizobium iriomotense]|uniref:hypothetical protein n=1 Tax=Bradyrhizobium iriomotense TaxID=441950 RepID=UPI001B8A10B9|nr:hypothetical protein [Bradyrhizobium iriomotense]MBR1132141.1 hypothetical protein [Bradyrhizobium iriomotense]
MSPALTYGCHKSHSTRRRFMRQSISTVIFKRRGKCNGQTLEARCLAEIADLRAPNINPSRSCIGTLVIIAARRESLTPLDHMVFEFPKSLLLFRDI